MALLFAFSATSQNQNCALKSVKESLVGIWQQVIINPSNGSIRRYIPYLKIINSDGTYVHMRMASNGPASFNAIGKWELKSENTFLEYVEPSFDLPKRTEEQTFRIETRTDGTFMFSQFHTEGSDQPSTSETWKKCGFSPYAQK